MINSHLREKNHIVQEHAAGAAQHHLSARCYHGLIHHLHLPVSVAIVNPFSHQPKRMQNTSPFHFYRRLHPSLWRCLLEGTFDTWSFVRQLHETMTVFNILISRNGTLSTHKESFHISCKHRASANTEV